MTFKSVYVWPNEYFPFSTFRLSDESRIFVIDNMTHNYDWLKLINTKIKPSDKFIVICDFFFSDFLAKHARDMIDFLKIPDFNFFICYNSIPEYENGEKYGLIGDFINNNGFIDYNNILPTVEKKLYDAILISRFVAWKRHHLAKGVSNLALIAGNSHQLTDLTNKEDVPNHIYINDHILKPIEVHKKICESKCGLILSAEEGACWASAEYLFCGIPVVSTKSVGGRDVWYDDYNSIIVDDDIESVKNGVIGVLNKTVDGEKIRNDMIQKCSSMRLKFVTHLIKIFDELGIGDDAQNYFDNNFNHMLGIRKMSKIQNIIKLFE